MGISGLAATRAANHTRCLQIGRRCIDWLQTVEEHNRGGNTQSNLPQIKTYPQRRTHRTQQYTCPHQASQTTRILHTRLKGQRTVTWLRPAWGHQHCPQPWTRMTTPCSGSGRPRAPGSTANTQNSKQRCLVARQAGHKAISSETTVFPGQFAQAVQRTPARAESMCMPQPDQVGLLQVPHVVWKHIV